MTDDLTTLLRDAGREPTIDLDVDAVHARGRRRATVRRAAAGVGTLALLGVLALGVQSQLSGDTELGPIDEAPPTEAPTTEAPDTGPAVGTTPRAALAAELGRDLVLHRFDASDSSWTLERTRTDGSTDIRGLSLPPMLGDPVVGHGALWSSTADGTVLRDGEALLEQDPELAGAWLPIGTDDAGNVVVTSLPDVGGEETPDGLVLQRVSRGGAVLPADLDPVTAVLPGESGVFAFDEAHEHAVVLGSVGPWAAGASGQFVVLVPDGGEPRDLLDEPSVAAAVAGGTVDTVAIVGDEVWLAVLSETDTSRIVRVPQDPTGEVVVLPLPEPSGTERRDVVVSIEPSGDGEVVLLGRRAEDRFLPPYVVRPTDGSAAAAITVLDAPGLPTLLPASCAEDTQAFNGAPTDDGAHLWFGCFPEGGSIDPLPFHRASVGRPESGVGVEGLDQLVTAFLAGPAESIEGVTALAPRGQVELTGLEVDRGRVTVTVESRGEPGVPSGSTDGGMFRMALAATILQFEEYDEVVIVADGICGDWEGTTDPAAADKCIVWTEAGMPWTQ